MHHAALEFQTGKQQATVLRQLPANSSHDVVYLSTLHYPVSMRCCCLPVQHAPFTPPPWTVPDQPVITTLHSPRWQNRYLPHFHELEYDRSHTVAQTAVRNNCQQGALALISADPNTAAGHIRTSPPKSQGARPNLSMYCHAIN
jgi:hypothetical protein